MSATTAVASYSPQVGDRFHRPAGSYRNPITGESSDTPEREAVVTMVSPRHVVVLIDGREYTMPLGEFVHLAGKTLANGSTLTRAA